MHHTVLVLAAGLGLLLACSFFGYAVAGTEGIPKALLGFVALWFLGAAINMAVGVLHAGYSVRDEAPVFVVVFAIPAALALAIWWKIR